MQNKKTAGEVIAEEYQKRFFIENIKPLTDIIGIKGGSAVLHFDENGKIRKVEHHTQKIY